MSFGVDPGDNMKKESRLSRVAGGVEEGQPDRLIQYGLLSRDMYARGHVGEAREPSLFGCLGVRTRGARHAVLRRASRKRGRG